VVADARKLVALYDRGALTHHGLMIALAQAATAAGPDELVPHLPGWVLGELRARANGSPRLIAIASVCAMPGFDAEAYFREENRLYADGLRRWAEFFAATDRTG
jgi:hypothetical protein